MPFEWWLRPVKTQDRVGEHNAVVCMLLYNNPFFANPGCSPNAIVPGDDGSAQNRCGFGTHAFARVAGQIYDGSGGQVDTDSDPDTAPAGAPRDLDGDDSWLSLYRARVIDDVPASSPGTPTPFAFGVF